MTATTTTSELLTLREAQGRLRVSHWTLHRLIAEREIPTVRIGRRRFISERDVTAFINKARSGVAR